MDVSCTTYMYVKLHVYIIHVMYLDTTCMYECHVCTQAISSGTCVHTPGAHMQ